MIETKDKAKEIFEYCSMMLAEGVYIAPKTKREMLKEIEFMIDTD
jgi:hypothetical protein